MIVSLLLSDDIDIVTLQNGAPQNKLIANNMKIGTEIKSDGKVEKVEEEEEKERPRHSRVCFAAEQR